MRTLILSVIILAFGAAFVSVSQAVSDDGYIIYDFGSDASVTISDPLNTLESVDQWVQYENDQTVVYLRLVFPASLTISPEVVLQLADPESPEFKKFLINLDDSLTIYPYTPPVDPNLSLEQDSEIPSTELEESLELTAEEEALLNLCYRGLEKWAPIQAKSSFEVDEFMPIFKDNLQKDIPLRDRAKFFQECTAMSNYALNNLSDKYLNLIIDDVTTIERGDLDDSRNFESGKTATPEEIKAEADRVVYPGWYKNPYTEWEGVNRGNPEPIISDVDAYNDYIATLAASVQTDADRDRAYQKAQDAMCVYLNQYGYLVRDGQPTENFPVWLLHCLS